MMAKGRNRKKLPVEEYDTPTEAQLSNGHYTLGHTPNPQGGNRVAPTYINRGGTPVMRWINAGKINENQAIAISLCYRLWSLCGKNQRTTANYGERMPAADNDTEARANTELEAREDLHRIQDYVPWSYWQVFENVCRFDEPAGVAGSRLGFGGRSAEDRAHQVVCFVADLIAMHERLIPTTRIRVA